MAAAEHLGDLLEQLRVEDQFGAGRPRQGLARQVVLRGAKAAGEEDQPGPAGGDVEGADVGVEVVGDGGVPADGDPDLGEAAAEPLAVGVEVLAAGQFTADGEDFAFHGAGAWGRARSYYRIRRPTAVSRRV